MATASTIRKIDNLNSVFYEAIGASVGNSHLAVNKSWKTWEQLLSYIPKDSALRAVDLGCGNGRWFEFLLKHTYTFDTALGIDTDKQLLEAAKNTFSIHSQFDFIMGNILDQNTIASLKSYDLVTAFGVWHHIPSYDLRISLLKQLVSQNNGPVIISFWQFAKNKRLLSRCLSPEMVAPRLSIDTSEFEPEDYFVGWYGNKDILRFCHSFGDDEIGRIRADIPVLSKVIVGSGNDTTNCYVIFNI